MGYQPYDGEDFPGSEEETRTALATPPVEGAVQQSDGTWALRLDDGTWVPVAAGADYGDRYTPPPPVEEAVRLADGTWVPTPPPGASYGDREAVTPPVAPEVVVREIVPTPEPPGVPMVVAPAYEPESNPLANGGTIAPPPAEPTDNPNGGTVTTETDAAPAATPAPSPTAGGGGGGSAPAPAPAPAAPKGMDKTTLTVVAIIGGVLLLVVLLWAVARK